MPENPTFAPTRHFAHKSSYEYHDQMLAELFNTLFLAGVESANCTQFLSEVERQFGGLGKIAPWSYPEGVPVEEYFRAHRGYFMKAARAAFSVNPPKNNLVIRMDASAIDSALKSLEEKVSKMPVPKE